MQTTVFLDHETTVISLLTTAEATGELPPRSLMLLITDELARLVLAIGVDDVPDDPPQHERVIALTPVLREISRRDDCHGALLAVGRYGDPRPRGGDLGWHDAFSQGTEAAGVASHGTYVVTPRGVRRVRPWLVPPDLLVA